MAAHRHVALLGLAVLGLACAHEDGKATGLQRLIEVTPTQEREMGAHLDELVRENLTLIDDPQVLATMNDVGQSLVRQLEPQP
jgi:predicted Zn-dependent protease